MDLALFSVDGLLFFLRWMHFFFGVTWIGLLYYFNFIQGAFFNEIDTATKTTAIRKLVPKALWWFRWGAMFTMISGLSTLMIRFHQGGVELFSTTWGIMIIMGASLGLTMFFNVWLIIWPNQKVVIASAEATANGGTALPNAALAGGKALLASRTNVLFSIPMLFFMGAGRHLPVSMGENAKVGLLYGLFFLILAGLELNAIKGKLGYLTTVKGVIHCALALTVVLYTLVEICL